MNNDRKENNTKSNKILKEKKQQIRKENNSSKKKVSTNLKQEHRLNNNEKKKKNKKNDVMIKENEKEPVIDTNGVTDIEKEEFAEEIKEKEEPAEEKEENLEMMEEKPEKNKFTLSIVLLAILLIIIGVCVYYQIDDKEKKNENDVTETSSKKIMDEFYEYFESKELKVIYYASSKCGYCELQTPIMEQIDKDYNIDYLYIDSTKLTSQDRETMLKKLDIQHATPTTVVVKDGKVIDKNIGYVDGVLMVNFLVNSGILKSDAVYTPEQYLSFIDFDSYKKIIAESGKHVITIGQTGCSHCIATKPVLNTIVKDYGVEINYLNLTDMSEEEKNSFFESLHSIGYNESSFVESGSFGTPLTLILEDGKVLSYVNGERPTSHYIRELKKAGIISK